MAVSITGRREPPRRGVKASLIAGVPAGLAARVAMAVLAGAGGSSMMAAIGQVTIPGTLRILIVPMVFGIPFAWLLLVAGARWAHRGPFIVASRTRWLPWSSQV